MSLRIKKASLGRSMIEMLGVLAVIGVLSIAALNVYHQAMERKKVGDVLHNMSTLGAVIALRDKPYSDKLCEFFEEEAFSIPTYFDSCVVNRDVEGVVKVTITYNTELNDRIIEMVARHCSRYMYISPDSQTFIFDPLGRDCSVDYSDHSGDTSDDDDDDDDD